VHPGEERRELLIARLTTTAERSRHATGAFKDAIAAARDANIRLVEDAGRAYARAILLSGIDDAARRGDAGEASALLLRLLAMTGATRCSNGSRRRRSTR
jgi:hypothetical protein